MHANSSNKKSASSLPRNVTTTNNNAPNFLYKHSCFLNTEKRKALGTKSGGVSFYGTMSTAKQQIASVTQAPHAYFDLPTQGSTMGGNFDRNPKGGIALRPIRLCVRAKHPRERNSRPNHRRHEHHNDALQGETQHQQQRCHDRLTHYRSHQR